MGTNLLRVDKAPEDAEREEAVDDGVGGEVPLAQETALAVARNEQKQADVDDELCHQQEHHHPAQSEDLRCLLRGIGPFRPCALWASMYVRMTEKSEEKEERKARRAG